MKKKKNLPEVYSEAQLDAIENHIKEYFGECGNVFHELVSPDIHADIYIIPPTEDRNFVTLVTVGMGAHKMNVPEELADSKLERAELIICLPPDWNLNSSDEKDYWPVRLLKSLARLPINMDTWLGYGHTVDNGESFAESTDMNTSLLLNAVMFDNAADICPLPDGEEVNFYQIIPIYEGELDYKIEHGLNALLDHFNGKVSQIVAPQRAPRFSNMCLVLDWKHWHCGCIHKKGLPLDEIVGYNHMAIFLRWTIENNLTSDIFNEYFGDVIAMIKENSHSFDLRELIRDEFGGAFDLSLFNKEGAEFASYYYDHDAEEGNPCYPCDIDDHALEYFGEERYNSEEFQNEAYLFVPYNEDYYLAMKKQIDKTYKKFRKKNK